MQVQLLGPRGNKMNYTMTKEEIQKIFPIGSKVKVIDPWGMRKLVLNEEYEVLGYGHTLPNRKLLLVANSDKVAEQYYYWRFELIDSNTTIVVANSIVNICPRCEEELIEKPSFGLNNEIIKKCPKCGWC